MPQLTDKENELLKMLDSTHATVIGKPRMKEVASMVHRLLNVADKAIRDAVSAAEQAQQARFERSAISVAAFGFVTRESIVHKVGLSQGLRERCIQLRENYDYAVRYREQNGIEPLIDYLPTSEQAHDATE